MSYLKKPLFTHTPQETPPHFPSQQPVFPFLSVGDGVLKVVSKSKMPSFSNFVLIYSSLILFPLSPLSSR